MLNVVETGQLKKKKRLGFLFSGRIGMKDKAPDCTVFHRIRDLIPLSPICPHQWLKLCPSQTLLRLIPLILELLMGMEITATFSSYCLISIAHFIIRLYLTEGAEVSDSNSS